MELGNIFKFAMGIVMLTGCGVPKIMSPVSQVQALNQLSDKVETENRTVVKEQGTYEYQCKDNKTVRVQPIYNHNKKNKAILLTFGQTSHSLFSTVTKQGKKYSNIRWIWREGFNGEGTLFNNSNKILAEHCKRK